uniref:Ferrous iron transporter, protein A n=1 Tax=Magnetococcus massalia (strain MO-1) TaxID=451514 RepID=A0A1S7LC89_MAGMO|nr:Ferrous iron transporter, protein A [Candidatus Magnetococcus massalia]
MTLADLKKGESVKVVALKGDNTVRQQLISMGLTVGKVISLRNSAPFGDPRIYNVMGYELSLRNRDAQKIQVEQAEA